MTSKKAGFDSVDDYIASFPDKVQKRLGTIRELIKSIAPEAREKISYQIPAFELNGKNLVYFSGWQNHISLYPIPSGTKDFSEEISPYIAGKGTLKFPLDKPMPMPLIRRIVKLHVAENRQKAKQPSNPKGKQK